LLAAGGFDEARQHLFRVGVVTSDRPGGQAEVRDSPRATRQIHSQRGLCRRDGTRQMLRIADQSPHAYRPRPYALQAPLEARSDIRPRSGGSRGALIVHAAEATYYSCAGTTVACPAPRALAFGWGRNRVGGKPAAHGHRITRHALSISQADRSGICPLDHGSACVLGPSPSHGYLVGARSIRYFRSSAAVTSRCNR